MDSALSQFENRRCFEITFIHLCFLWCSCYCKRFPHRCERVPCCAEPSRPVRGHPHHPARHDASHPLCEGRPRVPAAHRLLGHPGVLQLRLRPGNHHLHWDEQGQGYCHQRSYLHGEAMSAKGHPSVMSRQGFLICSCSYCSSKSSTICVCCWRTPQTLTQRPALYLCFRWAECLHKCCLGGTWDSVFSWTTFPCLSELQAKAGLFGEGLQKLPGDSFKVLITIKCNVMNGFCHCWHYCICNLFSPVLPIFSRESWIYEWGKCANAILGT